VTYLGVAHLAVRKSHKFAASLQMAIRILGPKSVDMGRSLGPDSIGIVVTAFTPAVQVMSKTFLFI